MRIGLAPMVTVVAPPSEVLLPSKSCQSAVKPDGIEKVVLPHGALLQGKVVWVLSQTNKPACPLDSVILHWKIPVGGEDEQLPPGVAEQEQGPWNVPPSVHVETCCMASPAGQS